MESIFSAKDIDENENKNKIKDNKRENEEEEEAENNINLESSKENLEKWQKLQLLMNEEITLNEKSKIIR